jgi:hypothetical protein
MSIEEQGQDQLQDVIKTPQRLAYEDAQRQMEERLNLVHGMAEQLVQRAAEAGVVLTIETVPIAGKLPVMGQSAYRIEARTGREVYQFLDALEKAAIASEQPAEPESAPNE